MTENEAKSKLDSLHYKIIHTSFCNKVYESEIEALCLAKDVLQEIQQYRAIGTVEELKTMKENGAFTGVELAQLAAMQMRLKEYSAIGTIEEFKELKDYKELYDVYRNIGSINEFRNLKNKKNVLPIANITIDEEDMQKMVDEKMKEIELDIQKIRSKTIDKFAERLKEKYGCLGYIDEITFEEIDKIAEEMRGVE